MDVRKEGKRERGNECKVCQREIWRQGEEGSIVRELKRDTEIERKGWKEGRERASENKIYSLQLNNGRKRCGKKSRR